EFNWGPRDTHCLVLSAGMRPREGKTTIEPHDGGRSVHADKQSLSTQSMRHQDDFTYQAAPQLSYVIQFLFCSPSNEGKIRFFSCSKHRRR
ncbi:hypothetical protein, partial [Anaerotruncus rubiinfantis]|uniref:hypothetical protein n=1 Tax=Anaerotruncus rubiinfantis TaxID=1720200 RepID=UPI0034A1F387